jgi:hypothetical protein
VHFGNRDELQGTHVNNSELAYKTRLEEKLSAYVPEVVLNCLVDGQNEWISELRVATIIFMSIDPKEILKSFELLDQSFRTIQEAIYRYEGQINKILFDDKGI